MLLRSLPLLLLTTVPLGVTFPQDVARGFAHILPGGLDHILFILGLFFLVKDALSLLSYVTLFTVAHSLSMGFVHLGFIEAPTQWVEVAIALSIVFVAAENLFQSPLERYRGLMVLVSGLVHGLGFAHAFEESSTVATVSWPALVCFNLGIELGQLCVVTAAFVLTSTWWQRAWYQNSIARPASSAIALAGVYWVIERSLG